jgi:hypothetical protein
MNTPTLQLTSLDSAITSIPKDEFMCLLFSAIKAAEISGYMGDHDASEQSERQSVMGLLAAVGFTKSDFSRKTRNPGILFTDEEMSALIDGFEWLP